MKKKLKYRIKELEKEVSRLKIKIKKETSDVISSTAYNARLTTLLEIISDLKRIIDSEEII